MFLSIFDKNAKCITLKLVKKMNLNSLKPSPGSVKNDTRQGRGQGSGGGGTARRGHKGAQSRSGYSRKMGFEGGQMPLQRRVPKFGFKNINRVEYKAINLDTLQALVDSTGVKTIDLGLLYNNGLIGKSDIVKVLGRGELTSAVEVRVNGFSGSAKEAIEKAGGSAVVDATMDKEKTASIVGVKTEIAVVAEAPKAAAKKKAVSEGDDLKKIEGIGPKIAELLNTAGITTFADLAATSEERLNEILAEAGSRYATHNPATWSEQASLARDGQWDELKELQDRLNGGKPE